MTTTIERHTDLSDIDFPLWDEHSQQLLEGSYNPLTWYLNGGGDLTSQKNEKKFDKWVCNQLLK